MRIGDEQVVKAGNKIISKKISKKGIVTTPSVKRIKKNDGLAVLKAKKAGTTTVTFMEKKAVGKKKIVKKTLRKYKIKVYKDPVVCNPDFSEVTSVEIRDLTYGTEIECSGADMTTAISVLKSNANYQKKEELPESITGTTGTYAYMFVMKNKKGNELYNVSIRQDGYINEVTSIPYKGTYKSTEELNLEVVAALFQKANVKTAYSK